VTHELGTQGGFPPMRTWQEPAARGLVRQRARAQTDLRDFLDHVAAAAPDAATTVALKQDLNGWADRLAQSAVPERGQIEPASENLSPTSFRSRATVTFGRYFLGGRSSRRTRRPRPGLGDMVCPRPCSGGWPVAATVHLREPRICTPTSAPLHPSVELAVRPRACSSSCARISHESPLAPIGRAVLSTRRSSTLNIFVVQRD